MNRDELFAIAKAETRRLDYATRLRSYRCLNWRVETRHKIQRYFEDFARHTRSFEYPFRFYVSHHKTGVEEVIQISASTFPTGAVNRTITNDFETGERISDALVVEKGGALIASLSVSGHVAFVVYPRTSDRLEAHEKQIFLYAQLDPVDITENILRKAVMRYMLYMRSTSVLGAYDNISLRERALLVAMKIGDVRNQYKTSRELITMKSEWGKLWVTGFIAWLVAYLTSSAK